jgi:hypothetical protein
MVSIRHSRAAQIFTILLFCVLPTVSFAQRGILINVLYDDPNIRRDVYSQIELKPLVTEYNQIIKRRIAPLKGEEITKAFGPKLEQRSLNQRFGDPPNCAAPLFAPYVILFSGLLEGEDKAHRDLYAIGNIGYIEFFYERDARFKTAVLYARLDDEFVPLQSANDFPKRLEWDKAKFDALKRWFDEHLVPIDDTKTFSPNPADNLSK